MRSERVKVKPPSRRGQSRDLDPNTTYGPPTKRQRLKNDGHRPCPRAGAQPECASTQNSTLHREPVFYIRPQALEASSKNGLTYDDRSSGPIIYTYVEGNPVSNIDPLGLETYICRRPLGGAPGSYAPPLLNHTYVCVGSGANMVCGSTTASSGGAVSNIFKGSPGAPTTPATDYFKPEACERRWGEDSCIETCIANALKNPKRPKYGVGPAGTDCQEYTEDIVSTCEKRCVRR